MRIRLAMGWDGAVIFACGAAVGIIGNLLVHFIAQQDERSLLQAAARTEGMAATELANGWDQVCTAGPGFSSNGWSEKVTLSDMESAVIFLNGTSVVAMKKFRRDVIPPELCFSSSQAPAFFSQPALQFRATR